MGWTCQHDHDGYCKLVKKACEPGMKGCTLKRNSEGIVFSSDLYNASQTDKEDHETPIDFAALAREN